MSDVPVSLYHTHGLMCTSKSYDETEYDTPKVFPFQPWKLGSISKITTQGYSRGACNDDLSMKTPSFPGESCCHLSSNSSEDMSSSGQQRSRHPSGGIDPDSHPACRALLEMGYSLGVVKKAADKLRKLGKTLSADTLIDVIVEEAEIEGEKNAACPLSSDEQGCEDLLSRDTDCRSTSQSYRNDVAAAGSDDSSCDLYSPAVTKDSPAPGTSDTLSEKLDSSQHQKIIGELRAENERLKQTTICKICLDANVDTLFLPCRHLVCCRACADNVRDCPICRQKILGTVRTFIA